LQGQIGGGDVLVNDAVLLKPSYRVRSGDRIEIELPAPPVTELLPESIPLDIIFEDQDLVVVNKPAGLVVHPGAGVEHGTLANALVAHFAELSPGTAPLRPGIVHRLDRDTSGLMVIAKNEQSHQHLAEQFAARAVKKHYVALVHGRMAKTSEVIDLPIGRHPVHRVKMHVAKQGKGRPAYTRYEVSRSFTEFSLLDVEIKTGRTHQIRVHLAHIHHPVVGDEIYGPGSSVNVRSVEVRRAINALGRHLLHAASLAFTHPTTGSRLAFTAPLPKDFEDFLSLLG
jgi:23S rRNA pseudouridine1911/1915/1917 synthase